MRHDVTDDENGRLAADLRDQRWKIIEQADRGLGIGTSDAGEHADRRLGERPAASSPARIAGAAVMPI